MDHTNEQQKILEQKRQEIAEQVQAATLFTLYKKKTQKLTCRTFINRCMRRKGKKVCTGLTLALL